MLFINEELGVPPLPQGHLVASFVTSGRVGNLLLSKLLKVTLQLKSWACFRNKYQNYFSTLNSEMLMGTYPTSHQ